VGDPGAAADLSQRHSLEPTGVEELLGIGEAIARRLAGEGLTVVLVGRDNARLRSARDRIAAAIPDADLALERADLARLDEVRQLADRLVEAPPPGVVISNAALIAPLDRRTPDGLPQVLTVNHLAPYLLMRVLAGALRGRRARFVIVGAEPVSLAHAPVDLDDLTFGHPERLGGPVELRPGRSTVMPGAPICTSSGHANRIRGMFCCSQQTVRGRPHRRVSDEKPVRPTKDHCASRQLCQESGSYAVRCSDSRREEGRTFALALIGPVGRVLDLGVLATMAALFRCCETVGR
jgi:hypothetical protein